MGSQPEQVIMAQILVEIKIIEERLTHIQQQREEHGFGDAPEAEYVEPKPPDRKQPKFKPKGGPALREATPRTEYVEPEPPDKYPRSPHYGAASCRVQFHTLPAESKSYSHKGRGNKSKPLIFSGSSKEPEDYLQWETNMEYWLRANNIPKDEKLLYAVDSLIGEAYKWWLKEDTPTFYKRSRVLDWEDLKARMYQEFVKKPRAYSHNAKTSMYQKASRSIQSTQKMLSTRENHSVYLTEHKRMSSNALKNPLEATPTVKAKEVQQEVFQTPMRTTKPLREPQVTLGPGKFSKTSDMKCFKCHLVGHVAATCPLKKTLKSLSLGLKRDLPKDSLVPFDFESSNSSVMHLSLSKGVEAGFSKEHTSIEEEPRAINITKHEEQAQDAMHSQLLKEPHPETHIQPNMKQEIVSTLRSEKVESKISPSVLNKSMTVLMHLSFAKSVETIADAKEKIIEQKEVSTKEKELTDQTHNQGGQHVTAKHSLVTAKFVSKVISKKDESIQNIFHDIQVSEFRNLIQH